MNSSAGGGTGVVINWPDDVGIGATAAAAEDDDDLRPASRSSELMGSPCAPLYTTSRGAP